MGAEVIVYKDWLYLRDAAGWDEGAFAFPTIAEIRSGDLDYKDIHIFAKRKRGCLLFVVATGEDALVGCAAYAYDDNGNYQGAKPALVRAAIKFAKKAAGSNPAVQNAIKEIEACA